MWIGGSSPAWRRHSTTAQSPPDSWPASLSSALEPWPEVTVRPSRGPVRTGLLSDMGLFLSTLKLSKPTLFPPLHLAAVPGSTPVEVNVPLRLERVDTGRCEARVRHPSRVP